MEEDQVGVLEPMTVFGFPMQKSIVTSIARLITTFRMKPHLLISELVLPNKQSSQELKQSSISFYSKYMSEE